MFRFALVAILLILTAPLRAERFDIDQYKASVNVPDTKGWFRKGGPQLRSGEFVVYAVNSSDKGRFGIAAIPGFPTNDLRHDTVQKRVMEVMAGEGFEPTRQRFGTNDEYVELVGGAGKENEEKFIMVARAILRNSVLFITFQAAKGIDEDANKAEFMTHIETLNFNVEVGYSAYQIAPDIEQLIPWHRYAYRGAVLAVVVLSLSFCVMLFITRKRHHADR